jgi:hypothetical protein
MLVKARRVGHQTSAQPGRAGLTIPMNPSAVGAARPGCVDWTGILILHHAGTIGVVEASYKPLGATSSAHGFMEYDTLRFCCQHFWSLVVQTWLDLPLLITSS